MSYANLLTVDSIVLDLRAADSDQVLVELARALGRRDPALAKRAQDLLEALRAREAHGSTGSQGVAIPHVKLAGIERLSIVVAVHQEGVDFRAPDGEMVHVFFSVVRPEKGAEEHLNVLRWIAGIATHQDFVSFARQAETPEQMLDLLLEFSAA